MTSLQTTVKQIPARLGYYVNVGSLNTTFYVNGGTDAAPFLSTSGLAGAGTAWNFRINNATTFSTLSTAMFNPGNIVLRDHGKTLLSSSRVFRKVQILLSTNSLVNGGTDGVAGQSYEANATQPYLTGYIELPGTGGYSTGIPNFSPVARLG